MQAHSQTDSSSMPEMAYAAEHHRHTAFIGRVNDFLVTHGTAGLDDAGSVSSID